VVKERLKDPVLARRVLLPSEKSWASLQAQRRQRVSYRKQASVQIEAKTVWSTEKAQAQ
jgi:hypothetical protein